MLIVDEAARQEAEDRLVELAGLRRDSAKELVQAALNSAVDQALETMAGSHTIPTSMTTLRAEQIRYICLRAGRILTEREVAVLFRATATAARAMLTNAKATYEDALRRQFLLRMRGDVKVRKTGTKRDGYTYTLAFTEKATLEITRTELLRLDVLGDADVDEEGLKIVIPRVVQRFGVDADPLDLLEIPK